ncbi:MAG TPA: energy transducer TonB [Opitutaceae bacterium]
MTSTTAAWALLAILGLGGCASAPRLPPLSLPEHYAGEAFPPSSFVARPVLVSAPFDAQRPRLEITPESRAEVRLEYVVAVDGRVAAARVLESNHPVLADALLRWLAAARFVPGQKDGRAVAVRVEMPYFIEVSRSVMPSR